MFETLYHLLIIAPIVLSALGASIGQSYIGIKALKAVDLQPKASPDISKILLVSMSLTETSAILGFVVSILLFLDPCVPVNYYYAGMGRVGVAAAIGISGFIAGLTSSWPAQTACLSAARQPFFSNKILQLMLLTQTIIMTPNLFGFTVALIIHAHTPLVSTLDGGLQLLAAGLCVGLGSIGPCIGLGIFTQAACSAIGFNRKAYTKILPFTFIGEAIIETPALFSLIVSLLILNIPIIETTNALQGIKFLAAALCMGLSSIGTGMSTGQTGSAACLQIGFAPEYYSMISKIGIISLAMIDTCAIYGFIISMILLYAI